MKRISILIPTAGQPAFLESALRAVARQTAVRDIEEVIVSENRGAEASRAVCERFSTLPIRYTMQDPPVSLIENYTFLFRQARSDLIAFLCDDDWWAPGHLQTAIAAFDACGDAAGWFSASNFVSAQMPYDGWVLRTPALWVAAGKPNLVDRWILEPVGQLAALWIHTPFHFSTMVLPRAHALRAIAAVQDVHTYQLDRSFYLELSKIGNVMYESLPGTFVSWRDGNVTTQTARDDRERAFRACTKSVWDESRRRDVDLVQFWTDKLRGEEAAIVADIARCFHRAMDGPTLVAHGLERLLPPNRYVKALGKLTRWSKIALTKGLRLQTTR